MALGGVATGSMKANEAEMVQGNMTYSGCILMAEACIKKKNVHKYLELHTIHTHANQASPHLRSPSGDVLGKQTTKQKKKKTLCGATLLTTTWSQYASGKVGVTIQASPFSANLSHMHVRMSTSLSRAIYLK